MVSSAVVVAVVVAVRAVAERAHDAVHGGAGRARDERAEPARPHLRDRPQHPAVCHLKFEDVKFQFVFPCPLTTR